MSSNKRKALDEVVVASDEVLHRRLPDSDHSSVKDSYFANLYTNEVDFKSLSKQDAEFAAMYGSQQAQLVHNNEHD
jgi:23S rRNA (adenine1618-N6)-methyltransferase